MTELFPFQVEGSAWLSLRSQALLADDMGLGKSAQSIRAADTLKADRLLVLCPAVARVNWHREFEKFSQLKRNFTIVSKKGQDVPYHHSVISSYDLAVTEGHKWPGNFSVMILDESHFLKAIDTKRSKAVFGKDGLVRRVNRVWALSGTPAPNHAGELWLLLYTFGVTTLTYSAFIDRYCHGYVLHNEFKVTGTKQEKIPELRAALSKIMLRRKKEDVMKELPEIFFCDVAVEAGPVDLAQESSFNQYVWPIDRRDELNTKLASEESLVKNVVENTGFGRDGMKALEALFDSVSTLRRYTGLQKVAAVAEIVKAELEAGAYDKIVLFAVHRDVIEGLRTRLSKFGAVTLYGGTDPAKKQRNIDNFQNKSTCRVFIGNIEACGTSITLTASHQVGFVEQEWVPARNAQAAMRCHRIGQTKNVNVRHFMLANSLDEKIAKAVRRKTKDLVAIFDVSENDIAKRNYEA